MNNQYLATPPTIENGGSQNSQCDNKGNLKTTPATALAGEDLNANVIRVEEQGAGTYINTATTTVVKSGAGHIKNIRVVGGTMGNVTIYDNTAASGTILVPTITVVQGLLLLENVVFNTGLTIVTSAATVIVISNR